MRWIVLLMIMLAGCADSNDAQSSEPETSGDGTGVNETMLPNGASFDGQIVGGEATFPCTPSCPSHAFTLDVSNVTMVVDLDWNIPANDIDLYIYHNGTQVAEGIDIPPQTNEHVVIEMAEAGDYRFEIMPYLSGPDLYELTVSFE